MSSKGLEVVNLEEIPKFFLPYNISDSYSDQPQSSFYKMIGLDVAAHIGETVMIISEGGSLLLLTIINVNSFSSVRVIDTERFWCNQYLDQARGNT